MVSLGKANITCWADELRKLRKLFPRHTFAVQDKIGERRRVIVSFGSRGISKEVFCKIQRFLNNNP